MSGDKLAERAEHSSRIGRSRRGGTDDHQLGDGRMDGS